MKKVHLVGCLVLPIAFAGLPPATFAQTSAPDNEIEMRKPARAAGAGRVFRDCRICPEMVTIPGGSFLMGSPPGERGRESDEGPQRMVQVRVFALGRYEVTFAEWDACVLAGGCSRRPNDSGLGRDRRPVIDVAWTDAQQYAAWLSRVTGKRYRLPSEAEWEYAARAGSRTRFSWGDRVGHNLANCRGCGSRWDNKETAPVGSFRPNRFGVYDMHGNVWEWVEDCWNRDYRGAPSTGRSRLTGSCGARVMRGGSTLDSPKFLRSAHRNGNSSNLPLEILGFRVSRTLP